MTTDYAAVAARLLAVLEELDAKVWPTAVGAAASERIRDLVKLKADIEAIEFALGHRPTELPEKNQT